MSIHSNENLESCGQEQDHLPKFLKLLYQILENREFSEYITWSHDGRALIIVKPVEFSEKLLPVYFKHSNYSSFVRQLNLYNFRKKKDQNYDNVFVNPMFVKDRKDLLPFIKRKCANISQGFAPSFQSENFSFERVECGKLLEENASLKRLQEQMAEKIISLEQVVKKLTEENENVHQLYKKKRHNEEILKKTIGSFAKEFGHKVIGEVTESALLANSETNYRKKVQNILSGNSCSSPLYMNHESEDLLFSHDEHEIPNPLYVKTVSTASTNVEFPMASHYRELRDSIFFDE